MQKVVAERKQSINDLKIRLKINWFTLTSEAKAALDAGATEAEMKPVRTISVMPSGAGIWRSLPGIHMHAPEEGLRMLIRRWIKRRMHATKLARLLATKASPMKSRSRISQQRKPQTIGLNMEQIKAEKQDFIKTVIPQWEEQARKTVC